MKHGTIKSTTGADIRSPIYAELGSLRTKRKFLARHKPQRGEKQRTHGR